MTPAPWGEHPALPPRLRVVRDCGHDAVVAEQAARIAELQRSLRDWQAVAKAHHDKALEMQRALESHEAACHAMPSGSSHWITEETPA